MWHLFGRHANEGIAALLLLHCDVEVVNFLLEETSLDGHSCFQLVSIAESVAVLPVLRGPQTLRGLEPLAEELLLLHGTHLDLHQPRVPLLLCHVLLQRAEVSLAALQALEHRLGQPFPHLPQPRLVRPMSRVEEKLVQPKIPCVLANTMKPDNRLQLVVRGHVLILQHRDDVLGEIHAGWRPEEIQRLLREVTGNRLQLGHLRRGQAASSLYENISRSLD
mmetsp:Transcript_13558/g.30742  ORF Transcript_13558/g.30742 Transcript_13558/m.30742 type:complete len:221 (-) Transcript_13558:722-1384(-)